MAVNSGQGGKKGRKAGTKSASSGKPRRTSSDPDQGAPEPSLAEAFSEIRLFEDLPADAGKTELLQTLLSRCLALFNCRSGSVSVCRPDSGDLELVVAEGPMREALPGTRQAIGAGIAGQVAEKKEGLFVENIDSSDEFSKRDTGRYETNSFACVPVVYRGELLGVLSLADKASGEAFSGDDVGRMLAVAGCSAGTIRQSLQQERLRSFNIELHRRLDAAIERLQDANQELARLKNFNESILTSILLGLLAFDEDFHVTFHNEPVRHILHLSSTEDLDIRLPQLHITCDDRPWPEVLETAVREGRPFHCGSAEYAFTNPQTGEEEKRTFSLAVSPLRDVRQRVSGGVVVIDDITERTRIERRLAASERHAVIGKLAARVAHELNNPLDGILRFINLSIALKGEDDQTRDYLTECKKGLERMVGIVSSLLEFSRSTYPTQHDTELNEVVREAVRTLRHRADQQHIEVSYDLEEDLPEIKCGELMQVFLNLTKNAYDAMKDGGTFAVRSRLEGDEVRVVVADTGCGMPKDIISRVFDPFFTTKGPSEGTGLGLAICYDIVEKHGGRIAVDSTEGKGTTFTITLPIR